MHSIWPLSILISIIFIRSCMKIKFKFFWQSKNPFPIDRWTWTGRIAKTGRYLWKCREFAGKYYEELVDYYSEEEFVECEEGSDEWAVTGLGGLKWFFFIDVQKNLLKKTTNKPSFLQANSNSKKNKPNSPKNSATKNSQSTSPNNAK